MPNSVRSWRPEMRLAIGFEGDGLKGSAGGILASGNERRGELVGDLDSDLHGDRLPHPFAPTRRRHRESSSCNARVATGSPGLRANSRSITSRAFSRSPSDTYKRPRFR